MNRIHTLFDNLRFCKSCNCQLPMDYPDDLCPNCKEIELFQKVRSYIRENDVTERDVASHFNLPLYKVKTWIREGRIEYKGKMQNIAFNGRCQNCGKPISLGTFCPECMQKMHQNEKATGFTVNRKGEDGNIRFRRGN
ncbi:MAG: hypothetical protein K6E13_06775 [Lachnospiraceae bacterium]|nr:hypothetical protein [Lachnospiraceae bacterium]